MKEMKEKKENKEVSEKVEKVWDSVEEEEIKNVKELIPMLKKHGYKYVGIYDEERGDSFIYAVAYIGDGKGNYVGLPYYLGEGAEITLDEFLDSFFEVEYFYFKARARCFAQYLNPDYEEVEE